MENFFTFNLGQVVQTIVIIIGGFYALGSMKAEIRYQGEKLEKIEIKVEKLETLAVDNARRDERMNAMDQRMMSQGRRIDLLYAPRKTQEETF